MEPVESAIFRLILGQANSKSTILLLPCAVALCRGVAPKISVAFTLASKSINSFTTCENKKY